MAGSPYLVDLVDGILFFLEKRRKKGGKYTSEWENSFETDRCLRVKDTTLASYRIVNEEVTKGRNRVEVFSSL